MANGRNPGPEQQAALRRVAIVLNSLPSSVAGELLGAIHPGAKQSVRRAMATLEDVDPLERRRAFHAFKLSLQQHDHQQPPPVAVPHETQAAREPAPQSQINRSPAAFPSESSPSESSPGESSAMSFLNDIDDNVLLKMLARERAQTVALVLASISPTKAGRVLPRMDARTQTEALTRIGRLEEFPTDVIADVAEHFRQRITELRADSSATARYTQPLTHQTAGHNPQANSMGRNSLEHRSMAHRSMAHRSMEHRSMEHRSMGRSSLGRSALDAILAAMPAQSPVVSQPPAPVASPATLASPAPPTPVAPPTATPAASVRFPSAAEAVPTITNRLSSDPQQPFASTDSISKHLESLAPAELCQALGKVDTQVAMLALCGLPNRNSEAALALLPKAVSKQVRSAIHSLGSLNLRDIDQAKEAVARVSIAERQTVPLAA